MDHLTGEYDCSLDTKGRVRLPSALLSQLSETDSLSFVINRGFEKCLMLYPQSAWERRTEMMSRLNVYNTKHRKFKRYFYRGATKMKPDSVDRILIPKSLQEYAELDREVVLFAYGDQIEIWSKQGYTAELNEEPDTFTDLAEEVMGQLMSEKDE